MSYDTFSLYNLRLLIDVLKVFVLVNNFASGWILLNYAVIQIKLRVVVNWAFLLLD